MAKRHKWTFVARFRANAYGWRGSALANKRLREAVREIKKIAKRDPVLAADGAVNLMERIWPALQGIDTSSGASGAAVFRTLTELLPIVTSAPADLATRSKWTERLYEAVVDDGVSYLAPVQDAWGEICFFPELAARWADRVAEPLRRSWSSSEHGWSVGSGICLSSLLKTGRFDEIDSLLALRAHRSWHHVKFAAEARVRQGKIDEALALAETCLVGHGNGGSVAQFCEQTLLTAGRREEAYVRYSRGACTQATHVGMYREIHKKYPEHDRRKVLLDLIGSSPAKGKWFAAAKEAGELDIALQCAAADGADPATLTRAARDLAQSDPEFALRRQTASRFRTGRFLAPRPYGPHRALSDPNRFSYACESRPHLTQHQRIRSHWASRRGQSRYRLEPDRHGGTTCGVPAGQCQLW